MKLSKSNEYGALLFGVFVLFVLLELSSAMSADEKRTAKEKVVSMFYHAYNAYMNNAYPADELMPLSCKGRYRGTEQPRGDVDDTLGNFTLTLIDAADTLAVLGDVEGFEEAVRNIIKDSRFDCDVIVSVFETNIRILGGLLGGHVMAAYFKRRGLGLSWYNNELLSRAKEVGDRLLPAFNTSTGIPYPRVNLKHGIVSHISSSHRDTCTACAGSMILEFAALSRLTGVPIYEEKARKAMDYLWHQRHRGSDLMGTIINVHSGDWVRRESGVGAGIDSYYEYVLKAYILLGDDNYLDRFNKHYDAVMRYVSQGPMLMDVHMHKPNSISRNFMDALLAFWPGLQVLKGDLVPAIETHEMLYQVMQRHNFIPEAFTTDFRIHWGHHPLRPEFIESTYFLYKATGDNYYLEAGKKVLDNLEAHAMVPCGLAAIKNVKTGGHEDQMDSYVLAEMFKYLYLLFAEKDDLIFDIDDFIFTTEAHLLPLSLSMGNSTPPVPKVRREAYNFEVSISPPVSDNFVTALGEGGGIKKEVESKAEAESADNGDHVCPALHTTHASGRQYPHAVRSLIKDIVSRVSPHHKRRVARLKAMDFIAGNKEQLEQLHAMGIRIATMADGRIQLLHTASEAHSPEDAEDGMQFMQEMIELSKHQQPEAQHDPMYIHVSIPGLPETQVIRAGPAQFGYDLRENKPVSGMLAITRPFRACKEIENLHELTGHIAVLERGDCMFVDKARNLQRIGARGGIVIDHTEGSSSDSQPLFAMSGDGTNDVKIPMLFLYHMQGQQLLRLLEDNSFLRVTLTASPETPPSFDQQVDAILTAGSKKTAVSPSEEMGKTEPTPSLSQSKDELRAQEEEEEEQLDSFSDHLDDKFYRHEAKLRDLYYLQVGTRYLHLNMEVRPAPASKPLVPLERRENVFHVDVLPDQSRMLTARLSYQLPPGEGYDKHKPQLNQMYVDFVHLLQLHTNFNTLEHTTDFLRALARALEAGYFGATRVDPDTMTLLRSLSRDVKDVHRYPVQPDRPVLSNPVVQQDVGQGQDQGQSQHEGVGEKFSSAPLGGSPSESYASTEDFIEESSSWKSQRSQASSSSSSSSSSAQDVSGGVESTAEAGGQFVRFVEMEDDQSEHGARVSQEGTLEFVYKAERAGEAAERAGEAPGSNQQQRNTFSVHMTAGGEGGGDGGGGERIVVQIKDEDNHVSQSQSFNVGDSQSQDSRVSGSSGDGGSRSSTSHSHSSTSSNVPGAEGGVSEWDQSPTSSTNSQSDSSGTANSQSDVSGSSSHSQSDSRASISGSGKSDSGQPASAGRGLDSSDGGQEARQSGTAGASEAAQVTESEERHQRPDDEL